MKNILIFTLLLAGLIIVVASYGSSTNNSNVNVTNENPTTNIINESENNMATILDVRTPLEYNQEHVKSSVNFNVENMAAGSFPEVDKNKLIYVYCRSGSRSAQAKTLLEQNGFTNIVDLGSLAGLKRQGIATE